MSEKKLSREELIKIHCENQDCEGCPKEEECEEAADYDDYDDYPVSEEDDYDPTPY